MALREIILDVTVPSGTPSTAPLSTPMLWDPGYLRKLHVVIPDGHAGFTGYSIRYAGQTIIPHNAAFIVSNDEKLTHDLGGTYVGQQWTFVAYNADSAYPHTFYLRAIVEDIGDPPPQPATPVAIPTPAGDETPLPTIDEALAGSVGEQTGSDDETATGIPT